MPTLIEAKNTLRTLSTKALAIVEDRTLDNAAKKAELDKLEPEVKKWEGEVQALSAFDTNPARRALLTAGDAGGINLDGLKSLASGETVVGGAAFHLPISFDRETGQKLYEAAAEHKSARVALKSQIDSTQVSPATFPQLVLPPIEAAREPVRLLDFIPTGRAGGSTVERPVTTGTTAAAAVAEATTLPQSNLTVSKVDLRATKIGHWTRVTDEVLVDFPTFFGVLATDMQAGIIDAENWEILNGTGVSPHNFTGLLTTSGIGTLAFGSTGAGETDLITLELAVTSLRVGGRFVDPDLIVMHPTEYGRIRRSRDANSRYLFGDPSAPGPRQLWDTPVLLTTTMPVGEAVVARLSAAAEAYAVDGMQVTTNAGTAEFTADEQLVKARERFILAVVRPGAICHVTGLGTTA